MKNVLVLGGGKVGKAVAELFLALGNGEYRVTVADRDEGNLREASENLRRLAGLVPGGAEFDAVRVDAGNPAALRAVLNGRDYIVCMLPFDGVAGMAETAAEVGVHYFDATEDIRTTERVRAIDAGGSSRAALVPQCGLAPGYVAIAAHAVAAEFTEVHDLTLRVGALPQFPTNALKYNITWSTAGVINEYCEPCNVMLRGEQAKVPPLEGLETFSFEGVEYEAFYTSGGVGTLIETLVREGRTTPETNIAYKTIRYPGHCVQMRFLLRDLRLGAKPGGGGRGFDRKMAVELLDHALPRTMQDVAVLFINCVGLRGGRREQVNFKRVVRATELHGRVVPAIELTTAAGVCGMVEMHRLGKIRQAGFVRQEECDLGEFQATAFGRVFAG